MNDYSDPGWEEYLSTGEDPTVGEIGPNFTEDNVKPMRVGSASTQYNHRKKGQDSAMIVFLVSVMILAAMYINYRISSHVKEKKEKVRIEHKAKMRQMWEEEQVKRIVDFKILVMR